MRAAALLVILGVLAVLGISCSRTDPPGATPEDSTDPSQLPPRSTPPPDVTGPDDSAAPPDTGTPPASALPLVDLACRGALEVRVAATFPSDLTSVSGLVASRRHPGVLWAVEDSLEPAVMTALDLDGDVLAEVRLIGGPLMNLDWEDLSIATGPDGTPWVHVADIGDNLGIRREIRVHRFPEPGLDATTVTPVTDTMSYDGDERPNAEALVVDPTGATWVIDKDPGNRSRIFRLDDGGVLRSLGEVALDGQVTAAELSADGSVLAVRTHVGLHLFEVPAGATLDEVVAGPSCATPTPDERQGESVAVLPGAAGLATLSEDESGDPVDLHLVVPAT